jgi:hypothetical protein
MLEQFFFDCYGGENEISISFVKKILLKFSKDDLRGKSVLVKIVAACVAYFGRIIPNKPITISSCFAKM